MNINQARKSAPVRIQKLEQRKLVMTLRKAGYTEQAIADQLGLTQPAVHRSIVTSIKELVRSVNEDTEEYRAIELARLEQLQQSIWAKATAGDLQAIDRVIRISERRSRLLGLDAQPVRPQEIEVPATGTEDDPGLPPACKSTEEWLRIFQPQALQHLEGTCERVDG